jgi:N-acetylmuramoyl-L-alanine amidase CwlA
MALTINQYNGSYNLSTRSGGKSAIKYIVVHYTGGTGSAKNNCIYFSGGNRNASADYFIDDTGVWQYNADPANKYSWAVGDGKGKYGITNANSISIEVVSNGEEFSAKEIDYLGQLVRQLMSTYSVDSDHVVRHYDASRKSCPAPYVSSSKWATLKSQILNGTTSSTTTTTSTSTSSNSSSTSTTTSSSSSSSSLTVDGYWGPATTKALQKVFGTTQDGIVSSQSEYQRTRCLLACTSGFEWSSNPKGSQLIIAMQKWLGISDADGILGPTTVKALQKKMGTTQDGILSKGSSCVMAMQKKLNAGTFK